MAFDFAALRPTFIYAHEESVFIFALLRGFGSRSNVSNEPRREEQARQKQQQVVVVVVVVEWWWL